MIRHGEAAADWGSHTDPGLSDRGRVQAEAVAREIERRVPRGPQILSSPLRRCRETALPLSLSWGREPIIEARVAEIPSPSDSLDERGAWLRGIAAGTWLDVPDLLPWRQSVIATLTALPQDTVIFSHYIAINVAMGTASSDDRIVCFRRDNGSITVFESAGAGLVLIEKGREADTKVN